MFAKEAAGDSHTWWLKLDSIDQREEAKSRALTGIY